MSAIEQVHKFNKLVNGVRTARYGFIKENMQKEQIARRSATIATKGVK